MSDMDKKFETWKDVIVNFFEHKIEKSNLCRARKYIEEKEKDIASEKNTKKLERLISARDEKMKYLATARIDSQSGEIREWINETYVKKIKEGKRIIKATHVLKFSHGSSESEGFMLVEKSNDLLLTTASFKKEMVCDIAHNNGALITISRFFALKLFGKMIIDMVLDDDFSFLESFNEDEEQLECWSQGFSNLVEDREIKTTDKAKQIYFPLLNPDGSHESTEADYHIIAPLFSSSMAEEVYTNIRETKFGNVQKEIRKIFKQGEVNKYHSDHFVEFLALGVQKFGGAQPQNISMLNKGRTFKADSQKTWGVTYLLSTQPPTWKTQLKPPVYKKSMFDESFFFRNIKDDINYLRDYLLRFEYIDLSVKNPDRRKWIDRWVENIIDEFLFYVGNMQNLSSGWSAAKDIKLKPEHQYLLDPYRKDDAFQAARKTIDWQDIICEDFAHWLNRRLVGKEKQFTPQSEHRRMWVSLLELPLRDHCEMLDAELKFQTGTEA